MQLLKALPLILAGGLLATGMPDAQARGHGDDATPPRQAAPKRLVVCMDGTWSSPARRARRDDGDQVYKPTNVLKTCRAIRDVDDVTATLVLTGQPSDGETVTIDAKTYTFQDRLTAGDGHVQIAKVTYKSLENLRYAINTRKGRNRYRPETTRHPTVEARKVPGDRLSFEIVVRAAATGGDPFAVSTTLERGAWIDKQELAAEYRKRGADPALGIPQIAYYDIGVGALRKFSGFSNAVHRTVDNALGGAAGAGFEGNVEDGYTFLSLNYAPGDEIFIFGFSRGACTARGLARFIDWMGGILPPKDAYWIPRYFDAFLAGDSFEQTREAIFEHHYARRLKQGDRPDEAREKANKITGSVRVARVKFLGVWDSVLALGKKRARPHVGTSPAAVVDYARQALGIDERRPDFLPRIWQRSSGDNPRQTLEQRWFAGVHSNVGGGYLNDGLANLALEWMLEEAREAGLGLDWKYLSSYLPGYPQDQLYNSTTSFWKIIQALSCRSKKGIRRLETSQAAGLTFHHSVFQRLASARTEPGGRVHDKLVPYRPKNLLRFLAGLPDLDGFLATIPGLPEDFELPEEVLEAIRNAR